MDSISRIVLLVSTLGGDITLETSSYNQCDSNFFYLPRYFSRLLVTSILSLLSLKHGLSNEKGGLTSELR